MRYLALLLLAPLLLILGWGFLAFPKGRSRTLAPRLFDWVALGLAAVATVAAAAAGFDTVRLPGASEFGPSTGAIWQQVLPALYGYGAFVGVLVVALLLRQLIWRQPKARELRHG